MGLFKNWRSAAVAAVATAVGAALPAIARASEAQLRLPAEMKTEHFLGGAVPGSVLLWAGVGVCILGLVFGFVIYAQLKRLPVHRSMLEVSELIYATCKTYLLTQLKFILLLWLFIGAVIFIYFAFLSEYTPPTVDLVTAGTIVHTVD